jgi:hypothetical protein
VLDHIGSLSNLNEVTRRLPNVTHLSLCKSTLLNAQGSPLLALVPILQNIVSLQLTEVMVDTPDGFLSLLQRSPRLRSISCQGVSAIRPASRPYQLNLVTIDQCALTPLLESIRLLRCHNTFIHWIVAYWENAAPPLTMLNLDLPLVLTNPVERLFQIVRSRLQDVRLLPHFHDDLRD